MADAKKIDEVLTLLFDTATDTRKFEVDLFWKRSLFFWGFIAAAFAGYATVKESLLALILACFGLVCSVVWALGNRGSKYWQEAWEKKVERIEHALPRFTVTETPVQQPRDGLPIQPMFETRELCDTSKGWWLRGRLFSVSKLTIVLSDFTSVVWLGLVFRSSAVVGHERLAWEGWGYLEPSRKWGWLAFPICSLAFLVLAVWKGQTTKQKAQPVTQCGGELVD